jgi:hypothetical protein
MRAKPWLSIINNDRILIFFANDGSCALKESTTWENSWLIFSLVSFVVLTWALASGVIQLFQALDLLTAPEFAVPVLFSAGWGITRVLFGTLFNPWVWPLLRP